MALALYGIIGLYDILSNWFNPEKSIQACIAVVNSDDQFMLNRSEHCLIEHRSAVSHQYSHIFALKYPLNFFIGGDVFTRGVTLDHLLVTIYGREQSDIDSVIQHARWYGHRPVKDRQCMRIFMPNHVFKMHKVIHQANENLFKQIEITSGRLEAVAISKNTPYAFTNRSRVHKPTLDQLEGQTIYRPSLEQVRPRIIDNEISLIHPIDETLCRLAGQDSLQHSFTFESTYHALTKLIDLIDTSYDMDRQDRSIWHKEVLKSHILVGTRYTSTTLKVIFDPNLILDGQEQTFQLMPNRDLWRYSYEIKSSQKPILVLARVIDPQTHIPIYWPVLLSPAHIKNYWFIHSDSTGES